MNKYLVTIAIEITQGEIEDRTVIVEANNMNEANYMVYSTLKITEWVRTDETVKLQ